MCGRYSLSSTPARINSQFNVAVGTELKPRYNITPGTDVLMVRAGNDSNRNRHESAHWGFTPAWLKPDKPGPRPINARAEGIGTKPMFRNALLHRRCIIPADGFYEWKTLGRGKQPWFIRPREDVLFGFAGIFEPANELSGDRPSCAIITTEANALMQSIHGRMPAILAPQDYARWLDPALADSRALGAMLRPCDADIMVAWPVSTRVNSPANDDETLIRPVDEPA